MAATKIRGLQQWCRRMTEGYAHVDIENFTTAWRNGMAFCALIHRFRPDLIDFDSLSPENVYENCKLAFEVAERELDIPAFLDAEDMAKLKAPDKLSVITYVSQYYNYLSELPQLGGPGVRSVVVPKFVSGTKRQTDSDNSYAPTPKKTPLTESRDNEEQTLHKETRVSAVGDKCGICNKKVYLLERHVEGGKLYHRSCFRHSELSPTNKVYTRSPYLSPSLNSETPSFVYPSLDCKTSILSGGGIGNRDKPAHQTVAEVKAISESLSTSRKSEGSRVKHTLEESHMESIKKSKLHSGTLQDEDKFKQASAIKDRLQSLKAKYSSSKSSEAESSLPLSGKEARKLERKREEVLASVKHREELPKSSKQNTALSIQLSNKATLSTLKNDKALSASTDSKSSTSLTAAEKASFTSKSPAVKLSASNGSLSKLDSASSKYSLTDFKSSLKSNVDKLDTVVLKKNTLSDLKSKSSLHTAETLKATQPVAKPRTGVSRPLSTGSNVDSALVKPDLVTLANKSSRDTTPKPAPRKSVLDSSEKKSAPERPNPPAQNKKSALHSDSVTDETDSSRSNTVSPPPLPISAPPPLPATSPVGEITPASTDRDSSAASSLHSRMHTEGLDHSKTSHGIHHKTDTNRVLAKDKDSVKTSIAKTSAHGSVKSRHAPEAELRTKSSSSPYDRRWSSPVSYSENHVSLHGAPAENKAVGQVVSGLLSSLTVIREGKSSSAVASESSPSSSPPPQFTAATIVSPHSEESTQPRSSSSSVPPINDDLEPSSASKLYTDTPSPANDAINIAVKEEISKTDILGKSEKLDNKPDQTNVSHNVDKSTEEIVRPRASSQITVNEPSSDIFASRCSLTLNTEGIEKKLESHNNKSSLRQTESLPTPSKRSTSCNELKQNAFSSVKDVPDINTTKHSKSELKVDKEGHEPATKEVVLNQVGDGPQKPPRLFRKSQVTDGKKPVDSEPTKNDKEDKIHLKSALLEHDAEGAKENIQGLSISSDSEPHSEIAAEERTSTAAEMPQWKKDIEERKKKLREDIARSESEVSKAKCLREKLAGKLPTISDVLPHRENNSDNQIISESKESLPDKPSHSVALGGESPNNNEIKENSAGLSAAAHEKSSRYDLHQESEERSPGFGNVSCEVKKNQEGADRSQMVNSTIDSASSKELEEVVLSDSVSDLSKITVGTREPSTEPDSESVTKSESLAQIKENPAAVSTKKAVKLKESEFEFMVNKTKLKAVEVDIDITSEQEPEAALGDQIQDEEAEGRDGELGDSMHLKHSIAPEDKSMGLMTRIGTETDTTAVDISESALSETFPGNNENSNNKPSQLKLTQALNVQQNPDINGESLFETIDLNSLQSYKSNSEEGIRISKLSEERLVLETVTKSTDEDKTTHVTPRVRRKITILGTNKKGTVQSPPASPLPMRKIEVNSRFDFDKSSDFEQSLAESTSRLTINDKNIPPPRPPPPRSNYKTVSPQHISAIELQQQLLDIDSRLTDLELRGRDLEDSIRSENTLENDEDALMIEWFTLVSEKNELVRKEADLVYITKEQDLEDEQEHIESQLRYLISKSDDSKSAEEKQEEGYLIKRKMELVEQRSKIVDSMDEDRLRYETEDRNIKVMMNDKALWRNSTGSLNAARGKKVAKSMFYS